MKSQRQAENPDKRPDEDTEAILSRRRFLIESTLASAGIGALASGCRPEVCLSIAPDPQVCLTPPAPDPEPEVCLEVEPPPEPPEPDPDAEPQVCLEVMEPEPPFPPVEPEPQVCLSVAMPERPPEPPPEPCLSPREP